MAVLYLSKRTSCEKGKKENSGHHLYVVSCNAQHIEGVSVAPSASQASIT